MAMSAPYALLLAAVLALALPRPIVGPPQATGDPHFVGARGTRFDFNGALGKSFCLFADKSLHINALIDGFLPVGAAKPRSWIKEVAFFWRDQESKTHQVVLVARRGSEHRRRQHGFISQLLTDGTLRSVPNSVGETLVSQGGFQLQLVKNTDKYHGMDRDIFNIRIDGLLDAQLALNPEVPNHWGKDDAEVHFNLRVDDIKVTPDVHGVLGQTFRPGAARVARALEYQALSKILRKNVAADQDTGAGFLDGTTSDYITSSLTSPDCKFATWKD